MTIQVMKFGVRRIVSGEEQLREQSLLAHRYYNRLIEIERDAREKYRALRSRYVPGLVECENSIIETNAEIDSIYDTVRLERKMVSAPRPPEPAKPTKLPAKEEQKKRLEKLRSRRKELSKSVKELRAQFDSLLQDAQSEYDRRASGISRELANAITESRAAIKAMQRDDPNRPGAKAALEELLKKRKAIAPSTHKKAEANARVLSEMLEEDWPQAWKELRQLEAEKLTSRKAARAESGIGHGAYASAEDAVELALKTSQGDPGFRRWEEGRGARKVGRQITGNVLAMQMLSGKPGAISAQKLGRSRQASRGNRARGQLYLVRVDLAKGLGVVEVECIFHRPIPDDARVRWVYLVPRLKPDGKWKWSIQFTLETQGRLIERAPGEGMLHVDFRWSLSESRGLIVAIANGRPIEIPRAIVDSLDHARRLQGYSDEHFDAARGALQDWLRRSNDVPDWLRDETQHIAKWRSHAKLRRIAEEWARRAELPTHDTWQRWKAHRLGAKLDLFCSLEEAREWLGSGHPYIDDTTASLVVWLDWWRRKDLHLSAMANGTRERAIRRRRDLFRTTAARLCTQYGTVEFGALDLKKAAQRRTPDRDEEELHRTARRQRVMAAPSELKEALLHAFGRERCSDAKSTGDARAA